MVILDWGWSWGVSFSRGAWLPNVYMLSLGFLVLVLIPKEAVLHSQRAQFARLRELVGLDAEKNLNMPSLEQLNKDLRGEHAN